jgi:hypothetical protein
MVYTSKKSGDAMSRIGITFEEVKKAIAELQGRQRNPSVDNIREVLGTGSKSTIARFLREWKAQHGLASDSDGRLPSDLLGIVNGLWDTLQHKADDQINLYRQESEIKTTQIQQQLVQARQVEATLRQSVHAKEEQLHQQNEEILQLKAGLMAESHEKIKMTERAASLDVRCQENHAENQRLHQLLKHVQGNLEHYQAATQKLREEQSLIVEKHQHGYEQRLSQLLAQVHVVTSENATLQAQHDHFTKAHESIIAEHKSLSAQHMALQHQHEYTNTEYEKIQCQHDELKNKSQMQVDGQAAIQHTVIELQLNIKSRDEKIISLEALISRANDKIETLRHESQFALQEKANVEGQLKQMQAMLTTNKVRAAS